MLQQPAQPGAAMPHHLTNGRSGKVERVRRLFDKAEVFDKAARLIEKYRVRAEAIVCKIEPIELRELLGFLVNSVLDRQPSVESELDALSLASPAQVRDEDPLCR